jgi:aldehyde dehydrogenase (NAD+)
MPFDLIPAQQDLLIDGERVPPASGRYFTTVNPATEQAVGSVAEADAEDVDRAVRSSRAAFEGPWAQMRAADRGHLLIRNSGQVCSAGSRILVHESAYDEVVARLAARAAAIRTGDPRQAGSAMGPLVSEIQMNRVLGYFETGNREGASLVTGGARHGETGYFVQPTVFANVGHDMRISQEEIFGPVAAVIKFSDDEDALRIANGTRYSLAAGVWSGDMARVHRFR